MNGPRGPAGDPGPAGPDVDFEQAPKLTKIDPPLVSRKSVLTLLGENLEGAEILVDGMTAEVVEQSDGRVRFRLPAELDLPMERRRFRASVTASSTAGVSNALLVTVGPPGMRYDFSSAVEGYSFVVAGQGDDASIYVESRSRILRLEGGTLHLAYDSQERSLWLLAAAGNADGLWTVETIWSDWFLTHHDGEEEQVVFLGSSTRQPSAIAVTDEGRIFLGGGGPDGWVDELIDGELVNIGTFPGQTVLRLDAAGDRVVVSLVGDSFEIYEDGDGWTSMSLPNHVAFRFDGDVLYGAASDPDSGEGTIWSLALDEQPWNWEEVVTLEGRWPIADILPTEEGLLTMGGGWDATTFITKVTETGEEFVFGTPRICSPFLLRGETLYGLSDAGLVTLDTRSSSLVAAVDIGAEVNSYGAGAAGSFLLTTGDWVVQVDLSEGSLTPVEVPAPDADASIEAFAAAAQDEAERYWIAAVVSRPDEADRVELLSWAEGETLSTFHDVAGVASFDKGLTLGDGFVLYVDASDGLRWQSTTAPYSENELVYPEIAASNYSLFRDGTITISNDQDLLVLGSDGTTRTLESDGCLLGEAPSGDFLFYEDFYGTFRVRTR